jgi:hypothetical protein
MGHLLQLLHGGVQDWLQRVFNVSEHCRPARILVCMIYYPDEAASGSWADRLLGLLGYDKDPSKVQLILRTVFERMNETGFDVHGIPVTCVPLFRVLDSTDTRDYVARVEPSAVGGRKMARHFMEELFPVEAVAGGHSNTTHAAPAPTTASLEPSTAAEVCTEVSATTAGGDDHAALNERLPPGPAPGDSHAGCE